MNWLTNFVRPKLQALVRKTEVPENLWEKCPHCGQMIFHRELEAALGRAPSAAVPATAAGDAAEAAAAPPAPPCASCARA